MHVHVCDVKERGVREREGERERERININVHIISTI